MIEGDRIVDVGPDCRRRGAPERRRRDGDRRRGQGGAARPRRPALSTRRSARAGATTCRCGSTWRRAGTRSSARSNPEEAYWAALASYSESIKCGVTTVNDMYRQLGGARARRRGDRDPRGALQRRRRRRARPRHAGGQQARRTRRRTARRTAGSRSTSGSSGCRSPREGLLKDARMLADDLDTGIHIHLNESLTEVENSKERFGRRPDRGRVRLRDPRSTGASPRTACGSPTPRSR